MGARRFFPFLVILFGFIFSLSIGLTPVVSPATAGSAACPDLVPGLTLKPHPPLLGQPFDATFSATNQGDAAAGSFYMYWYIAPATAPPDLTTPPTKFTRLLGLQPGKEGSWTEGGRYFFDQPGLYSIFVWVDRDNEVAECDEGNNLREWKIWVGPQGCQVDLFESTGGDNSCATASLAATDGTPYSHNLCPMGDVDWVTFQGEAGVDYRIVADNLGGDADLLILPFDKCDGAPSQKADASFSSYIQMDLPVLNSGPVYLQIRHYNDHHSVQDTDYRLSITARCSVDTYEPDNFCAAAPELAADGPVQRRSFCEAGDEDWLRVQAVGGHRYTLSTANWESNSQPILQLYQDCEATGIATSTPRGTLSWEATASGPVYVKVSNGPRGQAGLQSGYDLQLTQSEPGSGPGEPNDRPAEALPLAATGLPYAYALDAPGDQDWFYFAATGGAYRIETYDLHPSADTVLCLYPDLRVTPLSPPLACDDDGGSGRGSLIWQSNLAAGRYYLKVRHHQPENGGPQATYTIAVRSGVAACDGDSWEPDNHLGQSQLLEIDGQAQLRNFCPGNDEDWARFYIPTPGVYALQAASVGDDADPVLELYDVDGRTLLFRNDDYQPGLSSRILWRFTQSGNYYVRVRAFGGRSAGRGTEYRLWAARTAEVPTPIPTIATPTPIPTPTPTITPTPTATPVTAYQTLILYNRERMAHFFGEAETEAMVQKLYALAAYTETPGLVIDINRHAFARMAYATWDSNWSDVSAANRVADAIRSIIWQEIDRQPTIRFLVLVGDDRVLPLRRVWDGLPKNPNLLESNYPDISLATALGQALRQGYSLTDDFYGSRSLLAVGPAPLYLPDLAIGRLIETPNDVGAAIDLFLHGDKLLLDRGTVAAFGSREYSANDICAFLAQYQWADCSLVGSHWNKEDLLYRHFTVAPSPNFHLLYLAGRHWRLHLPDGAGHVNGADLLQASSALQRALILSLAGHGGLNLVPPAPYSLDMPEVYTRQGALVVGFTGYAPLYDYKISLAGRLFQRLIHQLFVGGHDRIGEAWIRSKQYYWQETLSRPDRDDPYLDVKILQNAVFYGIPMYHIPGRFTTVNAFPSVKPVTGMTRRTEQSTSVQLRLTLTDDYRWQLQTQEGAGEFYELDGSAYWSPEQAGQPLFYMDLRETPLGFYGPARNLLWMGATYSDTVGFMPLYPTVSGGAEDVTVQAVQASPPEVAGSWENLFPAQLDVAGERLAVHWGQFDPAGARQRLYTNFDFEVTFAGSEDTAGPTVRHATASVSGPQIKLEASDPSGVVRVVVLWTDGGGEWKPLELAYDPSMAKWVGTLPARGSVDWFAQVVDGAGNITLVLDKDDFFHLDLTVHSLYLPGVVR